MNIYVFRRPDGTHWAELSRRCSERQGDILEIIPANTRADLENALVKGSIFADERVKALAERLLDELMGTYRPLVHAPGVNVNQYAAKKTREQPAPWWQFWKRGLARAV